MRDNPKIFFKSEKKSKKKISNRNGLGNHSQTVLIIKSEKNYNCKISIKCLNPQILCYKSETSLKIKNCCQIQKNILEITKNILSSDTCTSSHPASEVFPTICHSKMADEHQKRA